MRALVTVSRAGKRLTGIVCVATLAVACGSSPTSSAPPSAQATPTTSLSVQLVFTNWAPDPNVISGPEPGYKPALTGLTAHDIRRATAAIDMTGSDWVINVLFTSRGADLFGQLTRDNVAACTSPNTDCAERHLAIWLDLTQTDIANWDDPSYAAKVSHPFDFACLAHTTATNVCPKFVSDPVTLQEIDGGSVAIAAGFTQQSAAELANAINSASRA